MVAGIDVLGNGVLHEIARGDDGDFSGPYVRFRHDAAHPAPVVGMRVGINHGRDWKALADMLLEKLPRCARHLRLHQPIHHDPTGLAPDEGDVGDIETAHLVDAGVTS
jgi:hypothetical protein